MFFIITIHIYLTYNYATLNQNLQEHDPAVLG